MPLDLEGIAPGARARYIAIGRRFSSEATLAQANQTSNGVALYGAKLVRAGFSLDDGRRLLDAGNALVAAGVGREASRTARKKTSYAYLAAMRDAKAVRHRARAILVRVAEILEERGDEASLETAKEIGAELGRTSVGPKQAEPLASQLDRLHSLLSDPVVAEAAADRGGAVALADATAKATALRAVAAERTTVPGTPAETERLDLVDGIIVELARAARRAARSIAKEDGEPAILALFELTHLTGADAEAPVEAKKPEPAGA